MSYIQPKNDYKDGDILYGIDLNASNDVIKQGVDDNFDRIQGLESTKQDTLTAGTGIEITEDNVINNTQTSAEWGNIQGDILDQTDLQDALGNKVDKEEGKGLSSEDYTNSEKIKLSNIESGAEVNVIDTIKVDGTALTPDNKAVNIDLSGKQEALVSGTNIKTINNQSILGSGNISVGGGSGGTSDYDQLDNRPQINNVTLTGNKSLSDLGINNPTKVSDLTNDAGYITSSYHDNTKQDKIDANNKLPYSYVSGTPTIPTKISDLTNDNNTVTDASYVHTDNNYTSAEKTKLAGIEAGAQVNVDEVLVGDVSSATEDTKLVIEDIDLDFQGSNIVNQYSNSTEDAYSCDYINKLVKTGKTLWTGSFTEGTITVPGLSNYSLLVVSLDGGIICIGNSTWGIGGIGDYGSYNIQIYGYRFNPSGDTLTIDNVSKGGSDGTQNVPVVEIRGIY